MSTNLGEHVLVRYFISIAVTTKAYLWKFYRHAAFSERRVRSDQRRTENTLSHNRQSQLESEYVIDFKDGARVDAIEIITTRVIRTMRVTRISPDDYLKCCRLACFIFEVHSTQFPPHPPPPQKKRTYASLYILL